MVSADKLEYVFDCLVPVKKLMPYPGGKDFILYSPIDITVPRQDVKYYGPTEDWVNE